MRLFSPAKINLFLRVIRKREDGYHDLASLFQAINLGDTLTFQLSDSDQLTCTDPSLSCDRTNLVWRAVDLFRSKTGLHIPIRIHLEKKIPIQSGLGGGSSNAATTLWALNELHGKPANREELSLWSGEIGSDIPFFFSYGTAYCTGRGEQVRLLPPLPLSPSLWVIKPQEGLSTPAIFKNLKLEECSPVDPEQLLMGWLQGKPLAINDLEAPALRVLPSLKQLKQAIGAQGRMTGSGTGFFCFGKEPSAVPSNVKIFSVSFIFRQHSSWYPF